MPLSGQDQVHHHKLLLVIPLPWPLQLPDSMHLFSQDGMQVLIPSQPTLLLCKLLMNLLLLLPHLLHQLLSHKRRAQNQLPEILSKNWKQFKKKLKWT